MLQWDIVFCKDTNTVLVFLIYIKIDIRKMADPVMLDIFTVTSFRSEIKL